MTDAAPMSSDDAAGEHDSIEDSSAPWQPLPTTERRVFGVLVEKAKTTPDAYPLTLNAITTGSNQKSNRSPLMNLEPIEAENALENLRRLGAVSEVHGSGRMAKYRHRVYEWLGVNKVEAAVMTELLLRGEQTLGELRGRAARMEPIADVGTLKPILKGLQAKGLVQALTPEGRGQIVTHCLYLPEQQEKLERTHSGGGGAIGVGSASEHVDYARPATTTSLPRAPPNGAFCNFINDGSRRYRCPAGRNRGPQRNRFRFGKAIRILRAIDSVTFSIQ